MVKYTRRQRAKRYTKRAGGILDLSSATLAGIGVGYSSLDEKIPSDLVVIGATAPIKGYTQPKNFFRGVMFGNRVKQLIGGSGINTGGYGF